MFNVINVKTQKIVAFNVDFYVAMRHTNEVKHNVMADMDKSVEYCVDHWNEMSSPKEQVEAYRLIDPEEMTPVQMKAMAEWVGRK